MSFSVALAFEDHTYDQYVFKPIITKLLAAIGRPRARVKVVTSPQLRGIDDLRRECCRIVGRYGSLADAVIFVVDADGYDGLEGRSNRAANLLAQVRECPRHAEKAFVIAGVQEVEVWALWGSRASLPDAWPEVRAERDPKEKYLEPLLSPDDMKSPSRGRTRLVQKSLDEGWRSFRGGCPELATLEKELLEHLGS